MLSVSLKAFAVVVVLFGFSGKSKAEICWEPHKTTPGTEIEQNKKGGKYKKNYTKNTKGVDKRQGKSVSKLQGKYTTSSGQCENDEPTPKPGKPGVPNVSVTNSINGTYTVSWTAASNMDTSGIGQQGYELLEYKNGTFVKKYSTSPTTRTQPISSNSDGNYQYKVRGCNTNYRMGVPVCGSYSSLSSTNLVRHKPSKPSAPSPSSSTSTSSLTLTMSKPSGSVAFYRIQKRKSGGSWAWADSNHANNTKSISGLTDGSWDFRFNACNDYTWACSSYSSDSSNVTVRNKPSAPAKPNIADTTINNQTATVSWSKPSGTVTFYRIQKRKNGGSWAWADSNHTPTSLTVSSLDDGSWDFRVRGCNQYSWACSNYSAGSSNVTARKTPSVPSAPTLTDITVTNGTVSLSWSKPNGSVTMYDVIQYKSGVSGYTVVADNTSATSLTVSNLSDGDYTYRVRACNEFDWSCSSYSGHSDSTEVRKPPSKPLTPTVSSSTSTGSVGVSWTKPSGSVGFYRIEKRKDGGSWTWADSNHTSTSLTVSGLTDGSWDFRVRACNQYTWSCSAFSSDSNDVTVRLKPSIPVAPTVSPSNSPDGIISVTWSKPAGAVSMYDALEYQSGVSGSKEVADNTASKSLELNGRLDASYTYRVRACNDFDWACSGYSSHSASVTVNHPTPDTPPSISVPSLVTKDNYSISWGASSSSYTDDYQVSQKHESGSWSSWSTVAGTTTIIDVDMGGLWTHKVRACNKLPDDSRKCSSAKVSSEVDVKLPPDWGRVGGAVPDAVYIPSASLNSDQTVGALEGSGGVSGGAAHYQIPIVIPPGRKGMQPSVSLNYSSRSGNGIAGVGWSVSAGSAISRCAATPAQDIKGSGVTYGSKDKLCLDGQRLIVVSGLYGASGAEYRTELDSFTKIIQSGSMNSSSSWFTVYYKNNKKSVYGSTSGSKHTVSGRDEILRWAIANTQDLSGNTISYDYGNYSSGENLLKTIYYTGNSGSNGDREVRFIYESRPDTRRSYMAGGLTTNSKRLDKIQTVYQFQVVREYKLTYEISPFSERSLLKEITECADNVCLKPTKVSTYKANYSWANTGSSSSANKKLEEIGKMVEPGDKLFHIDLNGDGVLEVIYSHFGLMQNDDDPVRTVIYARNELGDYEEKASNTFIPLTTGDMNLDGITDLIYVDQSTNKIGYKQYNDSFQVESYITNVPAPSNHFYASARQLDVNNDGFPDLIYRDYTSNKVKYYLRASSGSINFTGPYTFTTMRKREPVAEAHIREEPSYMDIDGDGYLDVLKTYLSDDNVLEVSVSFGGISNNRWVATNKSASQLGLPTNNFANQHFFADLNGDGLRDFIRPVKVSTNNFDWRVRLNKGDRTFSSESSLGTGLGIHEHRTRFKNNGFVNKVQSKWGGATFADFDNDGKDELFTPTHSNDNLCATFTGVPPSQASWEPYSLEVCNDDMHIEDKVALGSHPNIDIYIDFGQYDIRRFKWSIVDFKETSSGLKYSRTTPDVVEAPITGFNSLDMKKSWAPMELKDLDNDGLIDFSYRTVESYTYSHCNPPPQGIAKQNCYLYVAGEPYHHAIIGVGFRTGSPPISGGYFEQKNLIGTNSNDGKLADTAYEIENGLGVKVGWNYAPLSKHIDRPSKAKKFYYAPGAEYRYTFGDPKHFMFTSSMYLVSNSYHSNGLGTENQKRYSYSEAVYNRMGRGFQGFRAVAVDDLVTGTRSISEFHQKFPLSGKLEATRTCLVSIEDPNCEYSHISTGDYDWRIWRNGYISNQEHVSKLSDSWTISPGARYGVAPYKSLNEAYDLNSGSHLYSNLSETSVDGYGNVIFHRKTYFEDKIDKNNKVIKEVDNTYYQADENNWSISLLKSKEVTSKAVQNIGGDYAPRASNTNTTKSIKTSYVYNDKNLPETVTTAVLQGGGKTSSIGMSYTAFGLPKTVTTLGKHADGTMMTARTVSTTYSNDGYFPTDVTNAKGHKTSSVIDYAHGQPLSVTDPNGVVTTYDYDVFGRLSSTQTDGSPVVYKGYKWCNTNENVGVWCPDYDHPVYRVTQVQAGGPTVHRYFDRLNREVMSLTRNFQDTNWLRERRRFDERGLLEWETKPRDMEDPTSSWVFTYYDEYDELGRLLRKRTPQANGSHLITTYSYSGLVTDIIAGSLSMERKYNGLKQLVWTKDAMGGYTRYAYDGAGNPISLQDTKGHTIYAWHNALGHKTKVSDPNMGVKTFGYNTYGEVESETDANGDRLTMKYDLLGRLYERKVNNSLQASFSYDSRPNGKGLLASESATGISKLYSYNGDSRLTVVKATIDGESYFTTTEYDNSYGRVKALTYPSGIKVAYDYTSSGYPMALRNAQTNYVYQLKSDEDAYGNITEATLADGTLSHRAGFDPATGQMTEIEVGLEQGGQPSLHHLTYSYNGYSNLLKQVVTVSSGGSSSETYDYDDLHRLKLSVRNLLSGGNPSVSYNYDSTGNLISKSDYATTINYGGTGKSNSANAGPSAVLSILKGGVLIDDYDYDNNGNMLSGDGKNIQYNAFNKPVSISKNGITSSFEYGADLSRFKQTKGTETTIYLDKLVEINIKGDTTATKTFISDVAIVEKEEKVGVVVPTHNIRFMHRDRLGSVVTLTDHNNQILEHRSYDPFGKPRTGDFDDPTISTLREAVLDDPHSTEFADKSPFTSRGFTDHEHLDDSELIHMNGRAYDYNLGRFLSVDPFIQEPGNSQSMNPYSYIMNNPLAGTDPTGYLCESAESGSKCEFAQDDIEKYTVYEDKDGGKFTVATAKNGDTFKVESMTMTKNGAGSFGFSDVGGRVTPEELGSIKDMNKTTFGDVMTEAFSPENIKEQSELFRVDGNAFSNFLVDMTNDTVDGAADTVNDFSNGNYTAAGIGALFTLTKTEKIIPDSIEKQFKDIFKDADKVEIRQERGGGDAVRITREDGSYIDISNNRVKEGVPNHHPAAPEGQIQPVKFKNSQPGTKGLKRDPTERELELLKEVVK